MPGKYQKVGMKDLRYSGKYILASVLVEGLLLAPKMTITVGGKDLQIGGVLPMLQNEIAAGVRDGVNRVAPKFARKVETKAREKQIKETVIDKAEWLVYERLANVTLNSLATGILSHTNLAGTANLDGLFRDRLQTVIANKDDRDMLIASLTDFIFNTANTIFAGTSVSAFLNGGLGDNVKATVAELVDRGLQTEFGANLVNRLLDAVEQFETMTLAGFLERYYQLPRPAFRQYLADLYEKYLGTRMVAELSNLQLGEELYQKISSMDYDAVLQDMLKHHWRELIQVTLTAASVGLFFLNQSRKLDAKQEKREARKIKKAAKKSAKKAAKAAKKLGE